MLMNERVLKNIIKQDEDFQKFAMGRDIGDSEGEARGKALGIEEGKTLGIEEAKHDMVIRLYNQGVKLDIIANASNLSEEKVKEIINNSDKIKK